MRDVGRRFEGSATVMLDGIRRATHGIIGRIIMTILLGFLIVSFAIWGIGEQKCRTFGAEILALIASSTA